MRYRAVEKLLRAGYKDIVVVRHRAGEDKSLRQYEYERTDLAARRPDGQPVRVHYTWTEKDDQGSFHAELSDEAAYAKAVEDHGPIVDAS